MRYVYTIQSVNSPDRFYTGVTDNVGERLRRHNGKQVTHTSKFAPWRLKTYVAFSDESQALLFDKYLKTASGRAFAKKRL